jgi:hypothetical protein
MSYFDLMRRLTFALLTLVFAGAAHAQIITTQPPSPDANTPVTIVVTTQCGCPAHLEPITRTGNTFDIPTNPVCLSVCGPTEVETYDVGVLPPGIYTVRQFPFDDPAGTEVIGSFAVAAAGTAAVPTLGFWATVAMAFAMLVAGAMMLRS